MALTPEEQAELEQLNTGHSGLTPAEQAELDSYNALAGDPGASAVPGMKVVLPYIARAMDWTSGLGRVALAKRLQDITGKKLVSTDDLENALLAQAPTTNELLGRAGMEAGKLRTGLGIAGDFALDPGAIATMGGTSAARLIAHPLRSAISGTGKKIYQWGVLPLELAAKKSGKGISAADTLLKEGIYGTATGIEKQLADRSSAYYQKALDLAKKADSVDPVVENAYRMQSGGVDLADAMAPARTELSKLDDVIPLEALKNEMQKSVNTMSKTGRVSYQKAMQNKSSLYDALPGDAYSEFARTAPGARIKKAQARGIKEGIETGAEKALPGLGQEIQSVNQNWGPVLDLRDAAADMAGKQSQLPGRTLNSSVRYNPAGSSMTLSLLKDAYDAARMTPVSTSVGTALWRAGNFTPRWGIGKYSIENPLIKRAIRQQVIVNPWRLTPEEEQ